MLNRRKGVLVKARREDASLGETLAVAHPGLIAAMIQLNNCL